LNKKGATALENIKKIGNVILDYSLYKGSDLYSDGDVEDKLLNIVKEHSEDEYSKIISDTKSWPILYHLSHIRQNIMEPVRIDETMSVLEIGSGCGAITGCLSNRAKSVTCVDLSSKRSTINAYRNKDKDNIKIHVGNFQDVEKTLGTFDLITLIGVFEYGKLYIESDTPYTDFLKIVKKHLNPGGRLIIAIESKLGMKYFAGAREDHCGEYFRGIEGYTEGDGAVTFTRKELEEMFNETGFGSYKFMYPYPDYKFPFEFFSDSYLPAPGSLNSNHRNFDRNRLGLFDESKAFDNVVANGLFSVFANSYLVELSNEKINESENLIYQKCSDDRSDSYDIVTSIYENRNGRYAVKSPFSSEAESHIEKYYINVEHLDNQFKAENIKCCETKRVENGVKLEFLNNASLDSVLDQYYKKEDFAAVNKVFERLVGALRNVAVSKFEITDEFKKVFGDITFDKEYKSLNYTNVDMILSNIIDCGDVWKLIDTEWVFDFPIPVDYVIYRIMRYYYEANAGRYKYIAGAYVKFSDNEKKIFAKMEEGFQKYIISENVPIWELYKVMGKSVIDVTSVGADEESKLYWEVEEGFSESKTEHANTVITGTGEYLLEVSIPEGETALRFDPVETSCIITILSITLDNAECAYKTNGKKIAEDCYLYESDPNIIVENIEGFNTLVIKYTCGAVGNYSSEFGRESDAKLILKNNELSSNVRDLQRQLEAVNNSVNEIRNLTSWKLTKPVRGSKEFAKKVIRKNPLLLGAAKRVRYMITKNPAHIPQKKLKPHKEITSTKEITFILCNEEKWNKERNTKFEKDIRFSILVPLYNTPKRYLKEMIDSVKYQTYEKWELCLADGSDEEHSYVSDICMEYVNSDSRIKYKKLEENGGISRNTNACIEMSTGNYISLFDHDDYLHPSALFETAMAVEKHNADYIYTDEATFRENNIFDIITFHGKPDFAIDNLRANNYICHFSSFSKELLDEAGYFDPAYDGSQDHDIILRLTDKAKKIYHVRKLLYYWRSHPNSVAADINAKAYAIDAAKRAVYAHLERAGLEAVVESSPAFPTIFNIKYKINGCPKVSIIIPNKDHIDDLDKCLGSIINKTTYSRYEIIVVENNSTEEKTFEYYKNIGKNRRIKVIYYKDEFNYSKINNFAVNNSDGEFVLLLNNDTEIIEPSWIEYLVMFGQREDVGAVGAKLFYSDNTVQHLEVALGFGTDRIAGHTHLGFPRNSTGYMGRLWYAHDVSAVTAACMLVKRSVYEEVGGLDEQFVVAYNDVDFCMKVRQKGYLIVTNPYCELYHYESKSRGYEDTPEKQERFKSEVALFKQKWQSELKKGDPYYNPQFSLDRPDFYFVGCEE